MVVELELLVEPKVLDVPNFNFDEHPNLVWIRVSVSLALGLSPVEKEGETVVNFLKSLPNFL